MGHSADGSNRLKSNKALRTKINPYNAFTDYSKTSPSNRKYNFKIPTSSELKKLKASNREFLRKQKLRKRTVLIFGFAVGLVFLYWLSQSELWSGYVVGFGKFAK